MTESRHIPWQKSTFSSFEGNCVEVHRSYAGVLVRHSRRHNHWLRFTDGEWDAFVKGAKAGEFD